MKRRGGWCPPRGAAPVKTPADFVNTRPPQGAAPVKTPAAPVKKPSPQSAAPVKTPADFENTRPPRGAAAGLARDCRGELGYIETLIGMLVLLLLAVLVLNLFTFLTLRETLTYVCDRLLEAASDAGSAAEAYAQLSAVCAEAGLDESRLALSFDGSDYMEGSTECVQYGDLIQASIRYTDTLSGTGIFRIPVTISVHRSCLSGKYTKE